MSGSTINITDTGKRNSSDASVSFTQVDSGNPVSLSGFSLVGEYTVNTTNNVSNRTSNGFLTFQSNELTAIQAPRLTLRGLVKASETSKITNIVNLGRSKGIKQLQGGLGMINALPEVSSNKINVIVKNITFQEIMKDDTANIAFTIQLEQVQ